MIRRRQTSLLFACLLPAACVSGPPSKPDLPASVSPGWKLASLDRAGVPSEIPATGAPTCWKAAYAGPGAADVRVCWYKQSAAALDAVQRARVEAQTVKFQEGAYFVLVKWNHVAKTDLTALVRAIQKNLRPGE